jgi:hypothetical protein
MKKIVKNFNGFTKIYENEEGTDRPAVVETTPEDAKKAELILQDIVKKSIEQPTITSHLDALEREEKNVSNVKESIDQEAQINSVLKKVNTEEDLEKAYVAITEIVKTNAPRHPQFGKVKSINYRWYAKEEPYIKYESGGQGGGEVYFKLREGEKAHLLQIFKSTQNKDNALKVLAATGTVLGGLAIAGGIVMVIYGIMHKANIYDTIQNDLTQKYGLSHDFADTIYGKEQSNRADFAYSEESSAAIEELEKKGYVSYKNLGYYNSDPDSITSDAVVRGYKFNWDKILTSDQLAELSQTTQTFILGGAITSGVGALVLWASIALSNSNELSKQLDIMMVIIKAACVLFKTRVERLQNAGDIAELFAKDLSHLTVLPNDERDIEEFRESRNYRRR